MSKIATIVRNFARDEQAATTAEYGIIVVVMAAIAVAALRKFDTSVGRVYASADTNVKAADIFAPTAGTSGNGNGNTGSGSNGNGNGGTGNGKGNGNK